MQHGRRIFVYSFMSQYGSQTLWYVPIKVSLYLNIQYLQLPAADVGGPSFSLHVDALAYRCWEPSGLCVTVQDILKTTQTRETRTDWGGCFGCEVLCICCTFTWGLDCSEALGLWNAVKHIMMDDCVTTGIQIQLDRRQSCGFGGHGRLFFSSWKVCWKSAKGNWRKSRKRPAISRSATLVQCTARCRYPTVGPVIRYKRQLSGITLNKNCKTVRARGEKVTVECIAIKKYW